MTKKQKSVKEAWCIERINSKGNLFYLQVEDTKRHAEESLRTQGRNSEVTYRIRKWRAVKVCEWRLDRRGLYSRSCDNYILGKLYKDKFCGNCGGKIKVRK